MPKNFWRFLTPPSVSSLNFESERNKIIESFARRYNQRYEQKLDERIALNLELKYTQIGTNTAFVDRYFAKTAKTDADIQKELAEVIQAHRYVLIIGQAGAGKTTLLLETALALLSKAKEQRTALPVIFNLSSWRSNYTDFGKWLVDMLVEGNGFSRKLAEEVLAKKQILPLLDGLDELGRSLDNEKERDILRGQCLTAINQFLTEQNPEYMVICSRIEEYKAITENAPVNAEILVKPLTIEQIEKRLQFRADLPITELQRPRANIAAAQNILHLIKTNSSVHSTLQVPFYFHLAMQVFDSQFILNEIPIEQKAFEKYLVKAFVEKKLRTVKSTMFPNPFKNQYWLIWLSRKLNWFEITWFEITFLQPSKLRKPKMYIGYIYFIFTGLFFQIATWAIEYKTSFGGLGIVMITSLRSGNFFSSDEIRLHEKKIHVPFSFFYNKRILGVTALMILGYITAFLIFNLGITISAIR